MSFGVWVRAFALLGGLALDMLHVPLLCAHCWGARGCDGHKQRPQNLSQPRAPLLPAGKAVAAHRRPPRGGAVSLPRYGLSRAGAFRLAGAGAGKGLLAPSIVCGSDIVSLLWLPAGQTPGRRTPGRQPAVSRGPGGLAVLPPALRDGGKVQ